MKKLTILLLAVALASAVALSACGGKDPKPSVSVTPSVSATPECNHTFEKIWVFEGETNGTLTKVLYECSLCEKQEYRWEEIPSVSPSTAPSAMPSVEESVVPSVEPTVEESVVPSVAPSIEPSVEPTVEESVEPSVEESVEPSLTPSVTPSVEVSVEPSVTPSVEETATLVFHNSVTGEMTSVKVAAGETLEEVELPVPEVAGKDFVGWYDTETYLVKLTADRTFTKGETVVFGSVFVEENGIEFHEDIVYSAVAQTAGTVALITAQGAYAVSGTCQNGQIVVNAPGCIVQLTMNAVNLTCTTSAPVYVEEADKVLVYLPNGTETILQDTNRNGEKPRGVLHSKDDMNILGAGTLRILGANYSAIRCGADLSIEETTLIANSRDHAISADGEMELNANITVTATNGDGIRTEYINPEKDKKGNLIITGGTYDISSAGGDAFDVAKNITVSGGTVKAVSGSPTAAAPAPDSTGNAPSRKGIKANGTMTVTGGEITVFSCDDGINLGGNAEDEQGVITTLTGAFEMTGGTVTVTAGCDGINCSGTVSVTNATLTVTAGNAINSLTFIKQRGIKADGEIFLTGATTSIIAKGDGINTDTAITVSGGKLTVESTEDEGVQSGSFIKLTGGAHVICRVKNGKTHFKGTIDDTGIGSWAKEVSTHKFS